MGKTGPGPGLHTPPFRNVLNASCREGPVQCLPCLWSSEGPRMVRRGSGVCRENILGPIEGTG